VTAPSPCRICGRVARLRGGGDPFLVREFAHSILVVDEHQFHRGYRVHILKRHAREPYEPPERVRTRLFRELVKTARAGEAASHPWKMNCACLGNVAPHLRRHLIPRYENDPDRLRHPWLREGRCAARRTSPAEAKAVARRVRRHLKGAARARVRQSGGSPRGCGEKGGDEEEHSGACSRGVRARRRRGLRLAPRRATAAETGEAGFDRRVTWIWTTRTASGSTWRRSGGSSPGRCRSVRTRTRSIRGSRHCARSSSGSFGISETAVRSSPGGTVGTPATRRVWERRWSLIGPWISETTSMQWHILLSSTSRATALVVLLLALPIQYVQTYVG